MGDEVTQLKYLSWKELNCELLQNKHVELFFNIWIFHSEFVNPEISEWNLIRPKNYVYNFDKKVVKMHSLRFISLILKHERFSFKLQ